MPLDFLKGYAIIIAKLLINYFVVLIFCNSPVRFGRIIRKEVSMRLKNSISLRKLAAGFMIAVLMCSLVNVKAYAAEADRSYTDAEVRLLSALIYCEAQGEYYNGKLAVGIVVMNRLRSDYYPDTLKGVIYQKYQFSPATNGTLNRALADYDRDGFTSVAEKGCIRAAKAALSGSRSITVNGSSKSFTKYLHFSGNLKGYTFRYGNHKFK